MSPKLLKPAPDFEGSAVVNGTFKNIKLSDYKGQYIVLLFYSMDFTPVCLTEIIAFSKRIDEFKETHYNIVACSTDNQFTHFAWINTPTDRGGLGHLNFPLLSDKSMRIAKKYDVLDDETG